MLPPKGVRLDFAVSSLVELDFWRVITVLALIIRTFKNNYTLHCSVLIRKYINDTRCLLEWYSISKYGENSHPF